MKDKKLTLDLGDQEVTFSGMVFETWFGMLSLFTILAVLIAAIKYIIS